MGKDDGGGPWDLILNSLARLERGQDETRVEIKELTAKVEKNITKTEVLQVEHDTCSAARCKEIQDHLGDHAEQRKYWWGLAAAVGLLGLKELVTFWGGSK